MPTSPYLSSASDVSTAATAAQNALTGIGALIDAMVSIDMQPSILHDSVASSAKIALIDPAYQALKTEYTAIAASVTALSNGLQALFGPAAPTAIAAAPSSGNPQSQIHVTFTPTDGTAMHEVRYRVKGSPSPFMAIGAPLTAGIAAADTLATLLPGTQYEFIVIALKAGVYSLYDPTVDAVSARTGGATNVLDHLKLVLTPTTTAINGAVPTLTFTQWADAGETTPSTLVDNPLYTSSNTAVATVNATTGIVALVGQGTTVFTVSGGGKTATASLTVTAASSIVVSPAAIVAGPGAYQIQLTVTDGGVDKTADAQTIYTPGNLAVVQVDPPALTGPPVPAQMVQGGHVTLTFPIVNPSGTETLGGLTTGLTASAATVVNSTHIAFTVTAASNAAIGTANLYIIDTARGNTGTQPFNVNAAVFAPPLTGALRRYIASSGTSTTVDGALITTWTDTIGAHVLTKAANGGTGASQITYLASGINGKPAVKSTTTTLGEYMAEAAYDAALNGAAFSIMTVFRAGTDGYIVNMANSGSGHGYSLSISGNKVYASASGTNLYTDGGAQPALGTTNGHWSLVTAGPSQSQLFIDNTLYGTENAAYVPNASTSPPLEIFTDGYAVGHQLELYEVIIWDHILSPTTELPTLASYVSTAYGL